MLFLQLYIVDGFYPLWKRMTAAAFSRMSARSNEGQCDQAGWVGGGGVFHEYLVQ